MAIIKTGLQDLLMSAATLQGKCFIVNGLDRNMSYDGWVDPVNMSIEPPPSLATAEGTDIAGSLIVGGSYKAKFEYYNNSRGVPSGMSPVSATLTCPSLGGIRVTIPADSGVDDQVTHIKAYLTANGGSVFRYDGLKAYTGSAITYDFTVAESARVTAMGELATDGNSNIDVHGVFPACKYIIAFKGRIWGLGTEVFSEGTATMTADPTVTIAGDTLPTGIKGMYFQVDGDSKKYLISSRTDDTNLELNSSYEGTVGVGKTYYIYGENSYLYRTYININGVPYPESWNSDFIAINKDDNDKCTGIGIAHNQLVVFKTRATGIVSGDVVPVFTTITVETGCISGYTIDNNDKGELIFLSEKGLCITNGTQVFNLSESQIGNIFTGEGNPPWTVEKSLLSQACGAYDTLTNRYRLFITEDGETQNIKRVVYDFNKINGSAIGWYEEDGIAARCCGIINDSSGSPKLSFGCDGGSNGDKAYVYSYDEEVTNDGAGTTSTKRGTATASDGTSLTDSTATFTDDILGCNVRVNGEIKRIYTRDSATKITIESSWDTVPSVGDIYQIGFIDSYRQFKWNDLGRMGAATMRKIKLVFKQASHSCYVKLFQDYSTTAKIDKTVSLDTEKGYKELALGINRARLFQLKIGNENVDEPICIKEVGLDFDIKGKQRDWQ